MSDFSLFLADLQAEEDEADEARWEREARIEQAGDEAAACPVNVAEYEVCPLADKNGAACNECAYAYDLPL